MTKLSFYFMLTLTLIALVFSSCKEDEPVDITGVVSFAKDALEEIEGATTPLPVNMAIENAGHAGGSIDVEITGGEWGVDYETNTDSSVFTLDVAANSLSTSFTILPIDDEDIEEDLELTITLKAASGSLKLGSKTSMTFTILDNDEPTISMIQFRDGSYSLAEESTTPLVVPVRFDKASTEGGTITVESSGSAVYGTDYSVDGASSETFTLTVAPGDTSASFSVNAIDNSDFAEDKDVLFVLKEVTGGLKIIGQDSTTVTIVNDDAPIIPVVDFGSSIADSLDEDAGIISIPLIFSSALGSAATVDVTVDGASTATLGDDYLLDGGSSAPLTLNFASGATDATFELSITDDMDVDVNETIVLVLGNPTGDLNLGVDKTKITVVIKDNDQSTVTIDYLETFESNTGAGNWLDSALQFERIVHMQTIDTSKKITLNNVAGKFADPADPTMTSDNGLTLFYNSNQDSTLYGEIDNMVITPQLNGTGMIDVGVDLAYALKNNNLALVTFLWSETYTGNGTFNPSDWNVLATETALFMDGEGFGNNAFKRESYSINATQPFYLAVRIQQTVDMTAYRTLWRIDNFRAKSK